MSAARWQRLVDSLAVAGIESQVVSSSYPGGVSRSIIIRRPDGYLVEIGDRWWSKNADTWIGYDVVLTGTDDIVKRTWPLTKKRSEVVKAVLEATK